MRRIHLFETEDLEWWPGVIRQGMTDYLRFILEKTGIYTPAIPLLRSCLERSGKNEILDLCSGGGGAIVEVFNALNSVKPGSISIVLSDKFPNVDAFRHISESTGGGIRFIETPVDATAVPPELPGLRTLFSSFHHFRPVTAEKILHDAALNRMPIVIIDGAGNRLLLILGIIFVHPVVFFFGTPFIKPFKISRLVFTYLLPIIPLCTIWDGVISMLRLYKPRELKELISGISYPDYTWQYGVLRSKGPAGISFLTGIPDQKVYSSRS